jgi:hypothetical protein
MKMKQPKSAEEWHLEVVARMLRETMLLVWREEDEAMLNNALRSIEFRRDALRAERA